jgi:hypothetical protein
MTRRDLVNAAFLHLSMQAKLHRKLDAVASEQERLVERIERDEIRAYNDDIQYSKLEDLKSRVLAIRFLER